MKNQNPKSKINENTQKSTTIKEDNDNLEKEIENKEKKKIKINSKEYYFDKKKDNNE